MTDDGKLELLKGMHMMSREDVIFMQGYMVGVARREKQNEEAEKDAQAEDDSRAEKAG